MAESTSKSKSGMKMFFRTFLAVVVAVTVLYIIRTVAAKPLDKFEARFRNPGV